ncbi:MAG: peptidylprolyl isomerase [Planctomycetota bacterium]
MNRIFSRCSSCSVFAAAVAVAASGFMGSAAGQLTADRTYYGADRPIPVTAQAPAGVSGAVEIKLYASLTGEPIATAAADLGRLDLASLLPSLWQDESAEIRWAQLFVGGSALGSPLVIQPMVSPDRAVLKPDRRSVSFESDRVPNRPTVFSGIVAYESQNVMIETSEGPIEVRMRPDAAPNTVRNFLDLVEGGFYTDIIFHRIIPEFVVQVGDPTGTGRGGPGAYVDLEKSTLPHDFGVMSMARSQDPDSGGSQIFICLSRARTRALDGGYTAFAEMVAGADVLTKIAGADIGPGDRPTDPPVMRSARLVPAPPITETADRVQPPAAEPVQR